MTHSLNWIREEDGIHYLDDAGNEIMVAVTVAIGQWEARPDSASYLPIVELHSLMACEHYALAVHQTFIDTGH